MINLVILKRVKLLKSISFYGDLEKNDRGVALTSWEIEGYHIVKCRFFVVFLSYIKIIVLYSMRADVEFGRTNKMYVTISLKVACNNFN